MFWENTLIFILYRFTRTRSNTANVVTNVEQPSYYVTAVWRVFSFYGWPNVNLRQVGRRNTRYTCSKLEVMTGVVEVETERQVELTPNDGIADMHDKKTERINTEGMSFDWLFSLKRRGKMRTRKITCTFDPAVCEHFSTRANADGVRC